MDILIAGDYAPMGRVAEALEQNAFSLVFDEVKKIISDADYSIVNLEAPIVNEPASPIIKTGPNLKCSEKVIDSIKYVGFDCVTLANNHLRDYGDAGVLNTISVCNRSGVDFVGAGENINSASTILYKKIDDNILAVINVCENEWSIASEERAGAAPISAVRTSYQIKEAKQNADYVLLIIHGGVEHYQLPTPRMVELYRFFIEMGADAIVNHHQHCYSGYEIYKEKLIFYGLGNFCFDGGEEKERFWKEGYMVTIQFCEKISFQIHPYIQSDKSVRISLLSSSEYDDDLHILNQTIQDSRLIQDSYNKLVEKKTYLLAMLEPYSNRYINKLRKWHLFPSVINSSFKKKLFGIINCESHREAILNILNDDFN